MRLEPDKERLVLAYKYFIREISAPGLPEKQDFTG